MTMIGNNPWPFGRPLCLGSKFVIPCEMMGETALPTTWDTGAASAPWQSCKAEFPHDYERNRPIPLGKWAPVPVNTEAVWEYPARTREWPKQVNALVIGEHPVVFFINPERRSGQLFVVAWESNSMLLGNERSESNRKRLSVCKGTREAQPSMAVARIGRRMAAESLPMRRLGGGAPVVVRGRESRPHGEGVQDVSFWTTEAFGHREGSR